MATEKVRQLPVFLTDEERMQRSLRFAGLVKEEAALRSKRAAQTNTINEALKEVKAEIAACADVVATGRELREVPIEERKDLGRRVLEVFRLDTNEVIDSRHLSIEETQGDLPFERKQGEHDVSYVNKTNVVKFAREQDSASPAGEPSTRAAMDEATAPSSPSAGGASNKNRRRANVPEPKRAPPADDGEEPQPAPAIDA